MLLRSRPDMFLMKGGPMGQNLIVETEAHSPGNNRSPAFGPNISRLMATGDGYPPDLARREEKGSVSLKDFPKNAVFHDRLRVLSKYSMLPEPL